MDCELCELTDSLRGSDDLVDVGTCWTANVRRAPGRPAIMLQVREHRAGLASLQPTEAAELGASIQVVAAALERAPGVERAYAQTFNEAPGQHVHVHLVPRFRGETEIGPNVAADVVPPAEFDLGAVLGELRELSAAAGLGARGLPQPVTGGRRGAPGVSESPDPLRAADDAAQAAEALSASQDQLMAELKAARRVVDEQRRFELAQMLNEVEQARDHAERFRRLYRKLPAAVVKLKAESASAQAAVKKLRGYQDDFARVHDHQASIDRHLSVVANQLSGLKLGHQPDARAWRTLRAHGTDHVLVARVSLRNLSDRSVEVLRALGFEAERVELRAL